jgi:hypothetical protein
MFHWMSTSTFILNRIILLDYIETYLLNLKIKWGCLLITISVPLIFGAETVLAGILGVLVGSLLGQRLRRDYPTADPLVCGVSLLLSAPFLHGGHLDSGFRCIGHYDIHPHVLWPVVFKFELVPRS